ncbi:hypothetical protein [Butyrivibrio sp. XPD2002]|uniref:hypothetical protein n=1 Tax=Butyrivibrio sp. XPD2002 TaxID=1280665 RepID=UPI0004271EA0|nr:hypothetical protein [Butyrivibrio sp. XPD2002]
MNAVTGYLLCFGYVGLIIVLSLVARKLRLFGDEGARKFIHIMLCVSWVLGTLFANQIHAVIIPVISAIANYVILKKRLIPGLYREQEVSYGTVYYPISLALMNLVALFNRDLVLAAGIGAFALALGDGFAAIFGKIDNKYNIRLKKGKKLFGSLACLVFSFIGIWIVCYILHANIPISFMILLAVISMMLEFIGGKIDNLLIPLGLFVVSGFMISFMV